MSNNNDSQKGFTTLELMVVLTIIGILVAMAVSTYISTIGRIRLRTDARSLVQAVSLAKTRAQATGIGHGIVFVRNAGTEDRFMIFIDCDQNGKYMGSTSNPAANGYVDNWDDCSAKNAGDPDPLYRPEPAFVLQEGNELGEVVGWTSTASISDGANLEYILFNSFGQMTRNGNLATAGGNEIITVERTMDDGKVFEAGVQVLPATGSVRMIHMQPK